LACLHPSKGATALQDTSALANRQYSTSFCQHTEFIPLEPQVTQLVLLPNADRGDQLLNYSQGLNDKSQRVAGIFIAPLVMLTGLWLCLDGLEHGGLGGIFAIGPFVAVAGALWFVSDWF